MAAINLMLERLEINIYDLKSVKIMFFKLKPRSGTAVEQLECLPLLTIFSNADGYRH